MAYAVGFILPPLPGPDDGLACETYSQMYRLSYSILFFFKNATYSS
jgi:hypothetical protein